MFRVGDKVAHPMHGAGVIDEIVTETVAGAAQDYYVFRMPVGGLTLKIPTASGESFGLRGVGPEADTAAVEGPLRPGGGALYRQLEPALSGEHAASEKRRPL